MRFEGRLLPVEREERPTWLHQRLERRQVSRLHYVLTPADEWGMAAELTSGARIVFWSSVNHDFHTGHSPYAWRIVIRWMAPQRIVTARMHRYFGFGRDSGLGTAVTPHAGPDLRAEQADELQKRVEGEVIAGASPTYEPNELAGERIEIEFVGGGRLRLDALPPPRDSRDRADMDVQWIAPPERTHIWMPGAP